MNVLGVHLLLELRQCNPALLNDIDHIRKAMVEAAESVGAHVVGESFHRFNPQGVTGILAIGLLYSISTIMKKWSHVDPLSYLLKKESRDQFLARQISAYPSYLKANKVLTEKDKVMLIYMGNLGYLMDRPFFSDTFFEAHTLAQIIDQGVYAADILNRLKVQGITHVLFNYNNVFGKPAFRPESIRDWSEDD